MSVLKVGSLKSLSVANSQIDIANIANTIIGIVNDDSNMSMGSNALKFNQVNGTAGKSNIAIGENALRDNTDNGTYSGTNEGSLNVAIGVSALVNNENGKFNTSIGSSSLSTVTGGQFNTAVGYVAGQKITGNRNTAIGADAGTTSNISGNENVLIGFNAEPSSNTVSDEITLGDTEAKSFRIPGSNFYINGGSEGTAGNRVGIGTSSPTYNLQVHGENLGTTSGDKSDVMRLRSASTNNDAINFTKIRESDGSDWTTASWRIQHSVDVTNLAYIQFNGEDLNGGISLGTNDVERMRIISDGKVGIGTLIPTELLDVDGDAIRVRQSQTPASATANGEAGQICWDSNYVYVCVATNQWKRSALSTW